MKKVVHLFASQRVNRKARTDNEEVFREKVTLITNKEIVRDCIQAWVKEFHL